MSQQLKDGKLTGLMNEIVKTYHDKPEVIEAMKMIRGLYESSGHPKRCANCDASMAMYVFHFDCLDTILLEKMAIEVRNRLNKGMDFTIANQVHIPSLPTYHSVKCRTTQSSKLGLVAKLKDKKGKQPGGMWVITERGWEALRGDPVPAQVTVWRGSIEERFDQRITIQEARRIHIDKIEAILKKNRQPKHDYRIALTEYKPADWVDIAGYQEGRLL